MVGGPYLTITHNASDLTVQDPRNETEGGWVQ